jgi:hypothetical protein
MGAVTYPSPEVQRYIEDNFIPVQYNVAEHTDAADQFNSAWTPTIIVQDAEGREYRRSLGYLDPRRFLGEVALARLHRSIHRQDLRDATERVRDALEHTRGDTAREPEVLYFGAVVAYKSTGKAEHLKEGWDRLFKEFPESDWAKKTEFIRQ